ncbi:hypothetical protein [Catenovulum adriaticum]|uniref:Uncharacterized protein n=1 Tax=Catenovulum adriaticum TaxID=2984846 RepID=A0ABY7ANW8_9ALTE|nr:hypothetical protein [Catenovulum sp. TS8]WAJ69971.1 hypothetical protein OLW01_12610 [Catenovulum sp. TS8]
MLDAYVSESISQDVSWFVVYFGAAHCFGCIFLVMSIWNDFWLWRRKGELIWHLFWSFELTVIEWLY